MIEIFGPKILENFQNPFCKVFFKKSHDSQAFPPIDKSPTMHSLSTIPFNKALLHITHPHLLHVF